MWKTERKEDGMYAQNVDMYVKSCVIYAKFKQNLIFRKYVTRGLPIWDFAILPIPILPIFFTDISSPIPNKQMFSLFLSKNA